LNSLQCSEIFVIFVVIRGRDDIYLVSGSVGLANCSETRLSAVSEVEELALNPEMKSADDRLLLKNEASKSQDLETEGLTSALTAAAA
jgi:hypothetical protein